MNENRLVIDQVHAERFGGLTGRTVDIPSDGFVVVTGMNESGKSTLSELLAWLIAGPTGSAKDAQRFGSPDSLIGGALKGRIRGNPFVSNGKFKVLKNGAPNASGLTVDMGSKLQAAGWLAELGGTDPTVLAAIYRLRGEELHEGADVEEHLSKVALAGFAGRIDPRTLVEGLKTDLQRLTKSRAADAVSMQSLDALYQKAKAEVNKAGENADQHHRLTIDAQQAINDRNAAQASQREAQQRLRVAEALHNLIPIEEAAARLRAEHEGLATVPAEWAVLAADPVALANAIERQATAEQKSIEANEAARLEAERLGCSIDRLSNMAITQGALIDITTASQQLTSAQKAVTDAEQKWSGADSASGESTAAVNERLAALGASRAEVAAADLSQTSVTSYRTLLERWRVGTQTVNTKRTTVDNAERDLLLARQRRVAAEQAWDKRGTGLTAEAWLHKQMTATAQGSATWKEPRLLIPGVMTAVVVIAAVIGQWASAFAALVAAIAGFVLLQRHRQSSQPVVDEASRQTAVSEAEAVKHAATDEQHRSDNRDAAAHDLQAAEAAVVGVATEVRQLAAQLRFPSADSIEACIAILDRWMDAGSAVSRESDVLRSAEVARQALSEAQAKVEPAANLLASIITSCGLEGLVTPENAASLAQEFQGAARAAMGALDAATKLAEAAAEISALTKPVAEQVQGWRAERVLEEARRLRALRDQRNALSEQLDRAQRDLQVLIGADEDVRSRAAGGLDRAAIELELQTARAEVDAAEEQIKSVNERVWQLEQELQGLAQVDRIATLNDELGALREQRQDLALTAGTVALAAALLRDITGEYERTHQPALVASASDFACSVAPLWSGVLVRASGGTGLEVEVEEAGRGRVRASSLSTGARALLYLAFRLALASHDAERKNLWLPLLCDDPLVHLDDQRAGEVIPLLSAACDRGHQVLLFTCQQRTVDVARDAGATVVNLG